MLGCLPVLPLPLFLRIGCPWLPCLSAVPVVLKLSAPRNFHWKLQVVTEGLVLRVFCRPVIVGLGIFKENCRLPP
ncbi:hypothetical protein DPMN_146115 [Dreissena polymorpha]|uniref:Secreted protein n=1 Tax=Dreissena polymorpha TaxID=45954 RepID=A0A9D4J1T0_DREPO|nr:hypothetical protein DPMN_146115 [Dreissena polymorpha]